MSEKASVFRKISLDRISSPEQLNNYIRVSRPSVWLVLAAVTALLIGAIVWGIFGTLTTTRDTVAIVEQGKATCYVRPEIAGELTVGMPINIGVSEGIITSIATTPIAIPSDFDDYALYLGDFKRGEFVNEITADIEIQDGVYSAKMTLESISPIRFILN